MYINMHTSTKKIWLAKKCILHKALFAGWAPMTFLWELEIGTNEVIDFVRIVWEPKGGFFWRVLGVQMEGSGEPKI